MNFVEKFAFKVYIHMDASTLKWIVGDPCLVLSESNSKVYTNINIALVNGTFDYCSVDFKGVIFHPCVWIASISGLHFSCLLLMVWSIYLSCVNMNSISCMMKSGARIYGQVWVMVVRCMYKTLGRNCVGHVCCSTCS